MRGSIVKEMIGDQEVTGMSIDKVKRMLDQTIDEIEIINLDPQNLHNQPLLQVQSWYSKVLRVPN